MDLKSPFYPRDSIGINRRVIVVMADWKNSATAAPQNQLHLAECSCRKSCVVGCEVICGVGG